MAAWQKFEWAPHNLIIASTLVPRFYPLPSFFLTNLVPVNLFARVLTIYNVNAFQMPELSGDP
jgi:hypothetical protein